jgi:hypothetical protein
VPRLSIRAALSRSDHRSRGAWLGGGDGAR